jgi:hypothetical protein
MAEGGAGFAAVYSLGMSVEEARANKYAAEFSEQQLRQNAYFNKLQAEDAIRRGDTEAQALEKQTQQLIGSQRAGYAAQGIDVEGGSALAMQTDTAALSAEDQLKIRNNAWREAWGYRVQAEDLVSQAEFTRLAGKSAYKNAILAGVFNSINTGMSTYSALSGGGGGMGKQQSYNQGRPTQSPSSWGGFTPSRTPAGTPSGYQLSQSRTSWERR